MRDEDLVTRTLAGDVRAYEELVHRWAPRVLAYCRHRVHRTDVAEDLSQETWLRGYRSLASLEKRDRFGAWLRGIAELVCRDWYRSTERREVPLDVVAPGPGSDDDPGASSERREELEELRREMSALPDEYREVLTLYYSQRVTYQELAELLDVSAAAVNARLTKARALLRKRLTRGGRVG